MFCGSCHSFCGNFACNAENSIVSRISPHSTRKEVIMMILDNKNATVSFRCPICGKAIFSGVNIFRLSSDLLRLRCPDCDSALTLTPTNDKKLRLTVPCMICAKPHNFTVSESVFLDKDLFALPCPYSGLDILFAGKKEDVEAAMAESGETLKEMMEEAGIENLASLHTEYEDQTDPAVESIVRFLLCELEEEEKITCYCKEDGEIPLYDFQILSERVRIFCHCCNAEAYFTLRSEADAEDFIKRDRIDLK